MSVRRIAPDTTRVGWIGTGVMGGPMAGHVLKAGYALTVYNRTRAKAQPWVERGAQWADSPQAVAEQSEVVFTMLGFPRDVREVILGTNGVLAGARSGSIIVDMSTSEPSLAVEIYERAKSKGVYSVDAPVSGGDVGAREGTLSIMIGGDEEIVQALQPLFETLGRNIVYQGPAGSGQHTKMCNQIVVAGTMIGVCEALLYGYRAGLDLETMMASISRGAAACWTLDNLAPRILQRNFDPGFFVEHFVKDMSIALAEAEQMNLSLPGLALVHQLYVALKAQGHGKLGSHALMLALEQLSQVQVKSE
ncbi:MAG TPA: NAD(P)-dependent oxidoreductase [Armatimonadetes bacterium]|nr:NAD(P)-dependent oxidoreductase [Armatimonadota bacterium]